MILNRDKELSDSMPLGLAMAFITKSYYGALSRKTEYLGIDRHITTLILINSTEEKCTQQYLSHALGCDKVTMVRILDFLVEKEMINRVMNPDDRRERIIELTSKAKKMMPKFHKEVANLNNIALKGFTEQEQILFKKFIKRTINNLKDLPVNTIDIKIKK